ncbi:hypothetical protein GQ457_10G012430 [Hibiscus cannabinus]
MEEFRKGRFVDLSINHSFLMLIPEKEMPEVIDDYRRISLLSSLYKIVARLLSRRLSECMGEVIGESQFAFTPGKQIVECGMIANEVADDLERKKK